jgi:hypothetical protein
MVKDIQSIIQHAYHFQMILLAYGWSFQILDGFLTSNAYKFNVQPLSRSYLLRIWLTSDDPHAYRMLLENSVTGERKGFSDILEFTQYLKGQIQPNHDTTQDGFFNEDPSP